MSIGGLTAPSFSMFYAVPEKLPTKVSHHHALILNYWDTMHAKSIRQQRGLKAVLLNVAPPWIYAQHSGAWLCGLGL